MANGDRPGALFSEIYIERGEPIEDDKRMRFRIGSLLDTSASFEGLHLYIEQEMGVSTIYGAPRSWKTLLAEWPLEDVLNLITHAYRFLRLRQRERTFRGFTTPEKWRNEIARIFDEQNLQYTVDEHGSVRYRIDEEHTRNVTATLQRLRAPRYANVLHSFDLGRAALTEVPPNGKAAINYVFAAAESFVKLMLPDMPRLGGKEVEPLRGRITNKYHHEDPVAERTAFRIFDSFKAWVDASQFYRHEQGKLTRLPNRR